MVLCPGLLIMTDTRLDEPKNLTQGEGIDLSQKTDEKEAQEVLELPHADFEVPESAKYEFDDPHDPDENQYILEKEGEGTDISGKVE